MLKGLSFLKNASLIANDVVKPVLARTTASKDRNPTSADIRVYKNGAVYPSAALVENDNLGFQPKDATEKGFAYDVFMSSEYLNTANWPADERVIFIAKVPRQDPKTDLFSSTKFDENGNPTADVMTQGATTFGLNLLAYIKETYGVEPTEDQDFLDLSIATEYPFTTADGIYYVPKKVNRGEKKGTSDLQRRENLTLYPLVLTSQLEAENAELIPQPEGAAEQKTEAYVPQSARKTAATV